MTKQLKRSIRIDGDVAYVPLTKGYEAVIDAADVSLVSGRNWRADVRRHRDGSIRTVYAIGSERLSDGKERTVLMHRVIACTPDRLETDHIDSNGLNNRRSNLRPATVAQNQYNRRLGTGNTSGFKGACWHKPIGKWVAQIKLNGKTRHLGYYDTIEKAADAYAAASAELHGDFGRIA